MAATSLRFNAPFQNHDIISPVWRFLSFATLARAAKNPSQSSASSAFVYLCRTCLGETPRFSVPHSTDRCPTRLQDYEYGGNISQKAFIDFIRAVPIASQYGYATG